MVLKILKKVKKVLDFPKYIIIIIAREGNAMSQNPKITSKINTGSAIYVGSGNLPNVALPSQRAPRLPIIREATNRGAERSYRQIGDNLNAKGKIKGEK